MPSLGEVYTMKSAGLLTAEIINNDRMSGWQFSAGLRKEL